VWFYSLVNVIAVLSGSKNPTSKKYAKKKRGIKKLINQALIIVLFS
jgi:hypothetical protein